MTCKTSTRRYSLSTTSTLWTTSRRSPLRCNLYVRHLPAWLHLVLLSRRDVGLPSERLRAEGLLGEVQFAELRFAPDESREVLRLLAPDMSEQNVEMATARADGWAVGLRLAGAGRAISGGAQFSGADQRA